MDGKMDRKIALVTGGTGGIGTAICQSLYAQGLRVVASYNKGGNESLARAWQEKMSAQDFEFDIAYADVAQYDSCAALIDHVQTNVGPISVLINNAGMTKDVSFRKMDLDHWTSVMRTNLDSVFNVTKQVINGMIERGFGRIINISSINGQKGQFGQTNYASAKSGIFGFTKSLAQEVASKGITVNTVSPGYVETDMLAHLPEKTLSQIIANIPVGRLADPKEIARLVAFLAHEDSGFITGANFAINGGQYMS